MSSKSEQARELFLTGANCAQAVVGAFHHECGLSLEQALRLASGFGGGVARLREVCGTVSGMVIVANLLRGYSDLSDKAAKDRHYLFIRKLTERFRQETGSVVCRELLRRPADSGPDTPVSEARTPEYYRKRPCAELAALAAGILESELGGSLAD